MQEFKAGGWYLPNDEKELQNVMRADGRRIGNPFVGERLGYQFHKYERALNYVPREKRRTALDIGAHVGLWSWPMAIDFGHVVAFEPHPEHRKCWGANMRDVKNVSIHPFAVGNEERKTLLRTLDPSKSGHTFIDAIGERSIRRGNAPEPGAIEVDMVRLDDLPGLTTVDFIKIDCEGYELAVIQGAKNLIAKNRPVIIVEQKPETGGVGRYGGETADAVAFLMGMGMRWRDAISGDYIMVWE